ncbi:F-box domain protein [Ancylostoma duodenale]|uniref:F-box domain protein n=1 Tax=Ancylostoma duodenale TaxID=51022 RepID=A0A0C2GGQ5_9BILA|nr:F-box domain protein [Ancylostoma duodenale]
MGTGGWLLDITGHRHEDCNDIDIDIVTVTGSVGSSENNEKPIPTREIHIMKDEVISYSNLPPEMTEKILENVDACDLRTAQQVCVQWRDIINRRRHAMKRQRVKEIYISDFQDSVIATITHLSTMTSWESVSTLKIADYESLFDCIWIYSPKKLNINATRNDLRKALEGIPDWWFHGIQMKGHFSPRCSLLFEKVHGTDLALRNWINSHAQQVLYISEQTYNFSYRNVEIGVSVEQFVP